MNKLIKALREKGKKVLARKVAATLTDLTEIIVLPDSPEKIAMLKQYLIQLRARVLTEDPIKFLVKNKIFIAKSFIKDLAQNTIRYRAGLISESDFALESFFAIKNMIETLIIRYKDSKGVFPTEIDTVALQTMMDSL